MARTYPWKVSDALWERVEPLIPVRPPHPKGGRPAADDRQSFVCFVLKDDGGSPVGVLYVDAKPAWAFHPQILDEFAAAPGLDELQQAVVAIHSDIVKRGPALAGLDEA